MNTSILSLLSNPEDEMLLKVVIEHEPLRVAKQWGYEVHRLSPTDIVDKEDYARGYRYRLSKADPTQPYPQIVMARNEGEVATFLKRQIEGGNPDRVRFDRASIDSAIAAAKKLESEKDLYVFATYLGYTIDSRPPPGMQSYVIVHPDGSTETIKPVVEGNPIPDEELDLARTLAIIDSRPKGRIIESKLREEFGDAVIDALRQGSYVVSGSAGYNPPLLVSLKGRELIQRGNPMGKVITKEEAIGLLERLSMTPGEAARSLVADEAERREIMQTVQQRVKREQNKWAPMDPREGPPLPRIFAGLRWPWKK